METDKSHIDILDGWRGLSIILVLFSHWFPTPRALQINSVAGAAGMAIFFVLSGFLITQILLKDDRVVPFVIRRLCRILPLAWAAILILALANMPPADVVIANILFVSNLPPARLMEGGHHLWSLCVEVQFYAVVAALVALGGRRALALLPIGAIAITSMRVFSHEYISIVTWHRLDEILAGSIVALVVMYHKKPVFRSWHLAIAILGLLASSHPSTGALQYFRPYFAGLAVLVSIYAMPYWLNNTMTSRPLKYIARISYALYVIHGMLTATVLGGASLTKLQQYALRPVLAAVTFVLAHLSTFYYEKVWTDWGKRLASRYDGGARKP